MDFIVSAFKVSLRVVMQFDLDVVQCAVLSAMVPAIVFLAVPVMFVRVCEVYECRRLNREYLLWFSFAVLFGGVFLQCVCGLAKAGHHNRVEA